MGRGNSFAGTPKFGYNTSKHTSVPKARFLGKLLASEFPNSEHVRDVGLAAATDSAVWSYAKTHGMVIASKDTDFEQRALLLGHPPKVAWIRLGNCPTSAIVDLLRTHHADLLAFEADATASFLALS